MFLIAALILNEVYSSGISRVPEILRTPSGRMSVSQEKILLIVSKRALPVLHVALAWATKDGNGTVTESRPRRAVSGILDPTLMLNRR